jgi:hypothetical protein
MLCGDGVGVGEDAEGVVKCLWSEFLSDVVEGFFADGVGWVRDFGDGEGLGSCGGGLGDEFVEGAGHRGPAVGVCFGGHGFLGFLGGEDEGGKEEGAEKDENVNSLVFVLLKNDAVYTS